MLDLDFTFLWTIVNFAVLYAILRFVLFKPLGRNMRARSESIAQNIAEGERLKGEGESYREQYEQKLQETLEERRNILSEAKSKGERDAEAVLNEAKAQAARILEAGRAETERERGEMISTLRSEVALLALAAASKVMESDMDDEKNRALAEHLVQGMEVR